MDLYKGMRWISFTSLAFGTAACLTSGWVFIANRNIALEDYNNATFNHSCQWYNGHNAGAGTSFDNLSYYRKSVLRSCIVAVIVSLIQVSSGLIILTSPLQGSRQRAKYWFGTNIGLNLILFLCFIVPLMSITGSNLSIFNGPSQSQKTQLYNKEDSIHCSWWWMTSTIPLYHLDSFYISVCLDFVVHFLCLVFSLMMLRYDENRDYELVAIV